MKKHLALFLLLISSTFTFASIPQQINYQGKLTDNGGSPIAGTKSVLFTIYDASSGGTDLWHETQNVTCEAGLFNILLGDVLLIPTSVFDGSDRWLGINVESDGEMTPRQKLVSVGYAYKAYDSDNLGGQAASYYAPASGGGYVIKTGDTMTGTLTIAATGANLIVNQGKVGIGMSSPPAEKLKVDSGGTSTAIYGQYGSNRFGYLGGIDNGAYGQYDSGKYGYLGGVDHGAYGQYDINNFGYLGAADTGAYGDSNASSGYGVYGINRASSGTSYGVYGATSSTSGYGVYGVSPSSTRYGYLGSDSYGAYGQYSSDKYGYLGGTYGAYGQYNSGNYGYFGAPWVGAYGTTNTDIGYGVWGAATNSGTATNTGGYFTSAGTDGQGVYGAATAGGNHVNYGGYFQAAGDAGRAVYGYASSTSETNYGGLFQAAGASGYGVAGVALHTTGVNKGVYAETDSSNGYAVFAWGGKNYFQGDTGIGEANPTSKLTVAGTIETTSGGIKFPDATTQTTAFAGGANYVLKAGDTMTGTLTMSAVAIHGSAALTLKGNPSDEATAKAAIIGSNNTLAVAGSKLVSFVNNTTEKAYIDLAGNFVAAISVTSPSIYATGYYTSGTGTSMLIRGWATDGPTAIGTKIGCLNTLSTAGAKIISFYPDSMTTEKAYIDKDGGAYFAGTIETTSGGIKFPDTTIQTTAANMASYVLKAGDTMTGKLTTDAVDVPTGKVFNFKMADGTMPFTVVSTKAVTNLNADMLDGYHSTDFGAMLGQYVLKSGSTMTGTLTNTATTGLNISGNVNLATGVGSQVLIGLPGTAKTLSVFGQTRFEAASEADEQFVVFESAAGYNALNFNNSSKYFLFDQTGVLGLKVGIGTANPSEQLEITGNFNLPNTTATTGIIKMRGSNFIHAYNSGVFIGSNAGNLTFTGGGNMGIGNSALSSIDTGWSNTAFGTSALQSNVAGANNVAIGAYALQASNNNNNIAVGVYPLYNNSSGSGNIAFGYQSLFTNVSGSNNVGIGFYSLYTNAASYNLALGYYAGYLNDSGANNIYIGANSGYTNSSGANNTYIGSSAGYLSTGSGNTFIGYQAGYNETGSNKLYIANSNTATPLIYGDFSSGNVGINTNTLTNGKLNVVGDASSNAIYAQNSSTNYAYIGGSNEAVYGRKIDKYGYIAGASYGLYGQYDANNYAGLGGYQVGMYAYSSGAAGKAINANAVNGGSTANYGGWFACDGALGSGVYATNTNTISGNGGYFTTSGATGCAVKASATETNGVNYAVYASSSSTTNGYGIYSAGGKNYFGGKVHIVGSLEVESSLASKGGGGSWNTYSDARLKNVLGDYDLGLNQILAIKPVRYEYKKNNPLKLTSGQQYIGLIAQDVEKIIPEAVSKGTDGYLSLNADPVLWAMLNAIKEQQGQINELKARLKAIEAKIGN